MNITCVVGLCLLLYGSLLSGACNVTLHAQREPLNFTSPNYPSAYKNNDNCYWDIYPKTSGFKVVLDMVYSSIEFTRTCASDVLTIYVINNANQGEAKSYRICGVNRWNILIQEDQHFHVVFTTNSLTTRSGFLIRYYETNGTRNCGVHLVATSVGKTFTSPGYPNTHFSRQTCIWTITAEHQNQTIQLDTVDSLLQDISFIGTCGTDYVTVYSGQYGDHLLGTFCGNARPVFNSGGNVLSVRLRTDSSRHYRGFKMMYKAVPATTCNDTLRAGHRVLTIVSPGYPNNYVDGLDCQWTINAPTGKVVTVKASFVNLEKVSSCVADYLLFKDGTTSGARQLAKICEPTSTQIVSSSNHMTIIFHSDSAVTGGGFRLQYSSAAGCGISDLSASPVSWKFLTSPGYPSPYGNNVNCKWKIRAPFGYAIEVDIVFLSLQYSSSCSKDYLVFRDGSSYFGRQLGKYCTYYANSQVVSSGNDMTITFHTDGTSTRLGFSLKYKAGKFLTTTTTTIATTTGYWEVLRNRIDVDPTLVQRLFADVGPTLNQRRRAGATFIHTLLYYNNTFVKNKVVDCFSSPLSATTCNDTLRAGHRVLTIVSPGYPNNYVNGLDCQWTINAPTGNVVTVEASFLNLEKVSSCMADYLLFKDGTTNAARELAKICEPTSTPIVSSSNHMTIIFHSDSAVTGGGFRLHYSSVTSCGVSDLSASSVSWKYLTSPGYPSSYDNNVNCKWKIRAPFGYAIEVDIVDLSLQYSSSCSKDYLVFRDGLSYFGRQLGKYCGYYANNQVVSSGNYMTITFHTDGTSTRPGFNLKYKAGKFLTTTTIATTTTETAHATNCGSSRLSASTHSWRYMSSPGYPYSNYNNNMYCEWTISAPVGYKVVVQIQMIAMQFDLSCSKDYVLFRDGSSSYATRLGKYCSHYTGYIVSSRNAMTITFRTDSSIKYRGFSLKYIARTRGCGEDDTISYGTKYIQSPNYPLSYPVNADCEWTISTSIDGYVIHAEALGFNIEYSVACIHDYVELYDVTSFENSIGRWCGGNGPNIQTTGQALKVKFHSDGATSLIGFKLYITAKSKSGTEYDASTGHLESMGAVIGGVAGGIAALGVAACLCCALCARKKSNRNDQQQRNRSHEATVSFINVPSYPQTLYTAPTSPTAVPFMSPSPPGYNDVVKDDPPPYCQVVPLSDIQPVVTSSQGGTSEYQGIDNPVGPS